MQKVIAYLLPLLIVFLALVYVGRDYIHIEISKEKDVQSSHTESNVDSAPSFDKPNNRELNGKSAWILGEDISNKKSTNTGNSTGTWNEPEPTEVSEQPTVTDQNNSTGGHSSDDSSKMQSIANLFTKIGDLNVDLGTSSGWNSMMGSELEKELQYCLDKKYSSYSEFLDNGEPNPDYIFNPNVADDIYNQCVDGAYELYGGLTQDNSGVYNEIESLSSQAYDTALSCRNSNECLNYYWSFVSGFESEGLVAR